MDYNSSGSPVHGILQERIWEWVAIPFSRGSSQLRDWTWVSCIAGKFFTNWANREACIDSKIPHILWATQEFKNSINGTMTCCVSISEMCFIAETLKCQVMWTWESVNYGKCPLHGVARVINEMMYLENLTYKCCKWVTRYKLGRPSVYVYWAKEMVTLKESKMFQKKRISEPNFHQFLHVWYLVRTEFHICK